MPAIGSEASISIRGARFCVAANWQRLEKRGSGHTARRDRALSGPSLQSAHSAEGTIARLMRKSSAILGYKNEYGLLNHPKM